MITQGLISVCLGIARGLFSLLPSWSFTVGDTSPFITVVCSVCYLLPMGTITAIITINIFIVIFKSVISLIKTIWGILPFV